MEERLLASQTSMNDLVLYIPVYHHVANGSASANQVAQHTYDNPHKVTNVTRPWCHTLQISQQIDIDEHCGSIQFVAVRDYFKRTYYCQSPTYLNLALTRSVYRMQAPRILTIAHYVRHLGRSAAAIKCSTSTVANAHLTHLSTANGAQDGLLFFLGPPCSGACCAGLMAAGHRLRSQPSPGLLCCRQELEWYARLCMHAA